MPPAPDAPGLGAPPLGPSPLAPATVDAAVGNVVGVDEVEFPPEEELPDEPELPVAVGEDDAEPMEKTVEETMVVSWRLELTETVLKTEVVS